MKKLLLLLFILSSVLTSFSQGYKISGKLNGYADKDVYLAYHYGSKQYIRDTVPMDANGNFTFKGDEKLDGGLYLVVDPKKSYFEIIIGDDQNFSFETDSSDYVGNMKIKGSKENEEFFKYLQFITKQNKEAEPHRKVIKEEVTGDSTEYKKAKDALQKMDDEVKKFQSDFIEKNPGLFFSKILKAQREIEIPEEPQKEDSTFAWRYYKQHFFDNIDFSDSRMLRTPIYENKLTYYLDKLTAQTPDSIIVSADYLCENAAANDEVFKFTLITITNKYAKSKIMGFDAIYVHMVKNYYAKGKAPWTDPEQLEKIIQRAEKIEPLLMGKVAPNVTMQYLDTKNFYNDTLALHDVKAKYTFLYYWDPTCGHCKKFTPKLYEWFQANKDKYDIKTYAVCTIVKIEDIDNYFKENSYDWLNMWDPFNKSKFRDKYDIISTPVFYILDENKKIIAKRPNVEDLDLILENHSKNKEGVFKKMHEEQ